MAKRLYWAAFALLALTGTLRADDPQPDPQLPTLPPQFARPQPKGQRLVIRFDGWDAQTRLRLPASLLKNVPVASPNQSSTREARLAPSLVAASIALTLSAVTAGLWLARWRDRRLVGFCVLLVSVLLLNVSGCPWNEDPRGYMVEDDVGPLTATDSTLAGKVLLEQADGLDAIELVIDRNQLTTFMEHIAASK
jgi:hypothetical protein